MAAAKASRLFCKPPLSVGTLSQTSDVLQVCSWQSESHALDERRLLLVCDPALRFGGPYTSPQPRVLPLVSKLTTY